ncbi:MAG: hypothetical protein Q8R82_04310 [Hyphomonadaceae bacterium]|nr:hypothetical protein [Hyphomonadaceae bacterium]
MTALVRPVLFTQHFGGKPEAFKAAGLIEPILNCDTKLFVDPTLVPTSSNSEISGAGFAALTERYRNIIKLVAASKSEGDVAWKGAKRLLNLDECPETHLGYGGSRTTGSSRPAELRDVILRTTKQIVELGETDPTLLSLVGLFEEGVGPDTIGDFTSHCIFEALVAISAEFYEQHDYPTVAFARLKGAKLVPDPKDPATPILLVPGDIVRDLPLAVDWTDVQQAISQAGEIRQRFDAFFIGIAEPTITQKKQALRDIALSSRTLLRLLLDALLQLATNYDPNEDAFNYYALRSILSGEIDSQVPTYEKPKGDTLSDLHRVVMDIADHFKKQVEKNNLWELLWNDDRPKRERAGQLLFFAVADVFCKANNLDITPEGNMGGGPVDFKFSSGYSARVVVEMKLSNGSVVHGYQKQLEIYKDASETNRGVFVVVNVGKLGKKLQTIKKIQSFRAGAGQIASDIIVIDALPKASPSKA